MRDAFNVVRDLEGDRSIGTLSAPIVLARLVAWNIGPEVDSGVA